MAISPLGRSGLQVSRVCLGTMMFGGPTDRATAHRIIASARDAGVNFIDTADVYQGGESEVVTGSAIREDRDHWVLATKLGSSMGPGPNQGGSSRKWIVESVDASLRRLGTDYLDVVYLHRSFSDAALPEAVRALGDLIRQGKLRYFGVSNFAGWRIGLVCQLADAFGLDRPVASQPVYSAVERTAEREVIPASVHYGVGLVSYSPLARGVLTGKYRAGTTPDAESRAGRGDARMLQTEWRPESLAVAERLARHADAKGMTLTEFALGWVLANPAISSVIAGPRTFDQWEAYLAAARTRFDDEDEAAVDALVAPGHPSSPGYNDPAYPVEGRLR
ncbi:aldo/keto reductase [Agromyces aerolatus]|uniref:aldo/keto reductase n=1 Tax=Agromyces sp. LY-1074 TaxID=3074080 RepID=UPI002855FEB0|nr:MULTISPECIES: aldo/keto reductase [unclassified Agromyces]MDR5701585.1 aldo/keto reductase [Agromyces sp. LY-1074]MDR5706115.1 aldo/keto reductase [Agromyces sp. LY-1358]